MERKKVLVHESSVKRVMELIKEKGLKQGDKLPAERELAALLNISRSSVRETLQTLEANNIVSIRRGSGTYVNIFDDYMISQFDDAEKDELSFLLIIKDLLQARIMIEPAAIATLASTITEEQLENLYNYEEKQYLDIALSKTQLNPGLDFEQLLISMQPNKIVTNIHKNLNSLWKEYMKNMNAVALSASKRHGDHIQILEALECRDEHKIKKAVLNHLSKSSAGIDKLIQRIEE